MFANISNFTAMEASFFSLFLIHKNEFTDFMSTHLLCLPIGNQMKNCSVWNNEIGLNRCCNIHKTSRHKTYRT